MPWVSDVLDLYVIRYVLYKLSHFKALVAMCYS